MPSPRAPPIIQTVVAQHLEDAAALRSVRSVLVRAPHVRLLQLARADERLAAHLDGLSVAGDAGAEMARSALEVPGVGQLFVAAVLAIERRDSAQLGKLLALIGVVDDAERALAAAVGWVSPDALRGLTALWLNSQAVTERWLGITACALHRVDPGAALRPAIDVADLRLRTRALRAVGELGRGDLLSVCLAHLDDPVPAVRHAAARSALFLGDRDTALRAIEDTAFEPAYPPAVSHEALQLLMLAAEPARALGFVRQMLDGEPARRRPLRTAIEASGWAGQPLAVPWLIEQMDDLVYSRVAGEAFSLITGADLALLDLDRKPPEDAPGGPNDQPDDDQVALDADESLPWPDTARVRAWWASHILTGTGGRVLLGAPLDAPTCERALREATQRQRSIAALLQVLITPGLRLFNISAPAPRQQRALGLPVRVA